MLLKALSIPALIGVAIAAHDPAGELAIGTAAPMTDLAMKDVVGGDATLKGIAGKNGLLVIFSCNTCPFVIGGDNSAGWEGRYPEIAQQCKKLDIGFVLVNSNEAKREAGDGFADMQAHYKEKGYEGHYVLDQNHKLADAFFARTTPHVFLFSKDMKLAYKGAVDDNVDDAKLVTKHYLADALNAMAAGKPIDPATTRNIGCSIKRMPH